MAQECGCTCDWNGTRAQVKAILEPPELILRGGMRRRLPFRQIAEIRAEEGALVFTVAGENVKLTLGSVQATKWAKAILRPPPSLAQKLGITSDTVVRQIGVMDAPELVTALETAKVTKTHEDGPGTPGLIVACVNTARELARALHVTSEQTASGAALWLIYPKGKGKALKEADVRSMGLASGLVDTKVAAVSATLTGLKFVKRRGA